ncbi:maleylpyruvate isomerase N-terminal domain-containing protein [Ferruginibacter sp. SUN106]|uniref:maleylpyruvate isomerase N-terminal domain-containing protein n=1 Tax=Ferruginibacter sp. SUN106 TaxID=2978348 RepID=UPI003D35B137
MQNTTNQIPLQTLHLFPALDKALIDLLQSLTAEEWQLPTIAKLWTVKDIASHLLDGNLRTISYYRDNYLEAVGNINSYADLVVYLNQLNMSWTNATKRLSPQVLIELLASTAKEYIEQLQKLDPFETATFSVAWAGQEKSANWFHIAREYTEKFIHQQQIREAVGRQAILTKELFYPFIDTFMYALPHTYRNVEAVTGTVIQIKILTDIGGEWNIEKTGSGWELKKNITSTPVAIVNITPEIAWKLFSKGITPEEALKKITINGHEKLGAVALQMISVMA